MPCGAVGSRSSLSYIEEVTFGVTPVGDFKNLPFSTHSLDLTKERVEGTDIQSDRMPRVDRHGNRQVAGDIVADLRDSDYDDLLGSAFLNDWVSDELKIGTTPRYFSFEDYAADIDVARVFTGCTVNSLAVSLAPNQMITTTYSLMGKDVTIGSSEKTQTASSGATPFDSYSGTLSIGDAGGALSEVGIVTQMDFTLSNGIEPQFTIGSDSITCMPYGRATVEGTLTAFFTDTVLINRFLNEEETAISVSVDDPTGSNEYTFLFPRTKINGATVPVGGEGIRLLEIPFVALYDATEETNISITRPS